MSPSCRLSILGTDSYSEDRAPHFSVIQTPFIILKPCKKDADKVMKHQDTAVKPLLPVDTVSTLEETGLPLDGITTGTRTTRRNRRSKGQSTTSSTSSSARTNRSSRQPASRIVFGPGVLARLPAELGRLHLSQPLIVSSPSRGDLTARVQAYLPNLDSRVLDPSIIEHFPAHDDMDVDVVPGITDRDCVVSVGGGSAVAVARMIGLRRDIPHICIPTMYSGSELMMAMPSCAGESKEQRRRGSRRESVSKPAVIIYDEDLTMSFSRTMSAPSGKTPVPIAHSSESSQRSSKDDNALWSYLHLPGV